MIIRAFPKYLRLDDFPIRTNVLVEDGLYFNSGSNAIQFLLKTYSRFLSRSLNVAIQSFNCSTVSEAILRSGNNVFLFDVKETDFSLDYNLFVLTNPHSYLFLPSAPLTASWMGKSFSHV